jgi:hypothetical protein
LAEWKPRRSPTYRMPEGHQNRSPAVMAQRSEGADSLDDFPTPLWATRALLEHVLEPNDWLRSNCWEPTCGRGFMASALREYFREVRASDVFPFGFGDVVDFLDRSMPHGRFGWIVTNPPFRLAEEFVRLSLDRADSGVAMLVRTGFIETSGRYERLFRDRPPTCVAQFTERVPILRGRVDPRASTATGYCWLVWRIGSRPPAELKWIPPCRKLLERPHDYSDPRNAGGRSLDE